MEDYYLNERVDVASSLILKFYRKSLQGKSKINLVDFGCGDGRALKRMTEILHRHNIDAEKIFAVDINPILDRSNKVEIIKFDLNNCGIPIPSNSIQVAYGLESIEHLVNPDTYIKEVHRILIKDGLFVISTPNILAWYNRLLFLLGSLPIHYEVSQKKKYGRLVGKVGQTVGHIRVFSPQALKELLEDNGFQVLEIRGLKFLYGGGSGLVDSLFSHVLPLSSCFSCITRKVD